MSIPRRAIGRRNFETITAYTPDVAGSRIDLSDNTNQFGVPPNALRSVQTSGAERLARYPHAYAEELKAAIAGYVGDIAADQIVTGCGSNDVLDCALRAFAEPGDRVAMIDPTFSMVPVFARLNGLEPIPVPLNAEHDADVERILAVDAPIIYLCSPNNPTGGLLSGRAIVEIVGRASGIVIIDEAYAEFSGVSSIALLGQSDRLLVTRTFSKAFGLAGLRIGYGVSSRRFVRELDKSRGPYKVASVAEQAAVAALTMDLDWVRSKVRDVLEARDTFVGELRTLGLRALPSHANFVLLPVDDARECARTLRERGIAVRQFANLPAIGDAVRITIGDRETMALVARALGEVFA